MKDIIGRVVEVNLGTVDEELSKHACNYLQAELDGFVGDRHRSISREAWKGDKQIEGTIRRNERQWSAMSVEELADIAQQLNVKEPLSAAKLSTNICFEGIPQLSLLPRGTILKFPSGAELIVEEYNPPCSEMSEKVAANFSTHSGEPLSKTAFSQAAVFNRGLIGIIEVAGKICIGDEVKVKIYQQPVWISNLLK